MSNALVIYEKVGDPVKFSTDLANATAALVGCSQAQGAAVALTCLCEGITPLEFQRTYHLIQGKPSMRADAMLAKFLATGGKHRIVERSATKAAIELTDLEGNVYTDEFTWEQAQESRWPWKDWKKKSEGLKDNWATPTDQKAMLWARLVSDSLRAFAPQIVAGIYTPEEMQDADVVGSSVTTNGPKRASAAELLAATTASASADSDASDDAVEGEVVDETTVDATDAADEEQRPLGEGFATRGHIEKILSLSAELNAPLDQLLAKRGCNAVHSLPVVQAQDLIDKLEAKKKQLAPAKN